MPVEFRGGNMSARSNLVADRDLYLTRDQSAIVGEGEEAAYLLAREGMRIKAEWVTRLGLVEQDGVIVQEDAEPESAETASESAAGEAAGQALDATDAAVSLLEEHPEIDPSSIEGSGKDGRIVLSDVEAVIEAASGE